MNRALVLLASTLILALAAVACRPGGEAPTPAPAPGVAPPRAAAAPAPAPDAASLTAILASADAADGATDQVVTRCAGCRLGMDGKPEHALTAHGYTLHFCSDACKALNEPTLDATIASLK